MGGIFKATPLGSALVFYFLIWQASRSMSLLNLQLYFVTLVLSHLTFLSIYVPGCTLCCAYPFLLHSFLSPPLFSVLFSLAFPLFAAASSRHSETAHACLHSFDQSTWYPHSFERFVTGSSHIWRPPPEGRHLRPLRQLEFFAHTQPCQPWQAS